jgi:hypothetical protein
LNQAEIKSAQIGQCGVLLLQFELLRKGIESAPMTTDSGVDLVAYSPSNGNAITIQVKTNLKPKPGGGRGKSAVDWRLSKNSPAKYVALVDLKSKRIWLLSHSEMASSAQQKKGEKYHFYMYEDSGVKTRTGKAAHCCEFEHFLLKERIHEVFGV